MGQARLRGPRLHRARLQRVVRQRRRRASPTRSAARRAGCTSPTYATRRATSSSSPGMLADEGLIDGQRIGVTGGSYGGGVVDGPRGSQRPRHAARRQACARGRQPGGQPMRIAGAGAVDPVDRPRLLAGAQRAHARLHDHVADRRPRAVRGQEAVVRQRPLRLGPGDAATTRRRASTPAPDLTTWFAHINAGEPYGADERAIAKEIATYHSSYYLDHSRAPAPLLISNGWTDDLFPVDEALRYYNRTRAQYPDAPIALMFFDYGHSAGRARPRTSRASSSARTTGSIAT